MKVHITYKGKEHIFDSMIEADRFLKQQGMNNNTSRAIQRLDCIEGRECNNTPNITIRIIPD